MSELFAWLKLLHNSLSRLSFLPKNINISNLCLLFGSLQGDSLIQFTTQSSTFTNYLVFEFLILGKWRMLLSFILANISLINDTLSDIFIRFIQICQCAWFVSAGSPIILQTHLILYKNFLFFPCQYFFTFCVELFMVKCNMLKQWKQLSMIAA